jgi:hypothetical protein
MGFCVQQSWAQFPVQGVPGIGGSTGGRFGGASAKGADSLKKRTGLEDSITISFRTLDTVTYRKFDSSLFDFSRRFPIPYDHVHLGNHGSATKPIYFDPIMRGGWNHGFHAFDVYKLTVENTRFFNTTRPYSEIGYLLGSRAEQSIHVLVTQNVKPNWNIGVQYGLINAPGYFKNQNTSHSRYRIHSMYRSPNKRYQLFTVIIGNKLQASENGGIANDGFIDSTKAYSERSNIPVQLGNYVQPGLNPFNSSITTGNRYRENVFLFRQQYDLGKKDSLQTDSSVVYLFYPRIRLEHQFRYNRYQFSFVDQQPEADYYVNNYDFLAGPAANFSINEQWNDLQNSFSIYAFPIADNPAQFLKAGVLMQQLWGTFDNGKRRYDNLMLQGEYRNKTKNQQWDLLAAGHFYLVGLNAGDYDVKAQVKKYLSKKWGYFQASFENVNRTPSFVFSPTSSFNFGNNQSFNKENITRLKANLQQPAKSWEIEASYTLTSNFTYFSSFYQTEQQSSLFNVLSIRASKDFKLRKHLVWHGMVLLQQRIGNSPVNLPLLFTRHQIGYEGDLGFSNLRLNTGLELRYHTPYAANGYSPLVGQFFYQDQPQLALAMPDIHAYLHFRIRSFTSYVRLENLNTMRFLDGFGFTNNNFSSSGYPYPGLVFRVGIFWSFVN